ARPPARPRRPAEDRAALRPRARRRRPRVVLPAGERAARVLGRGRAALRRHRTRRAGARLDPARAGRQPVQRLVRAVRGPRGRGGPAGRPDRRRQGQHRGRGRADDERLAHGRGVHPAARRHRRRPDDRRGRHDHRQGRLRGPLLLRRLAHLPHRSGAQPLGRGALGGRLVVRQRGAGRGRDRRRRHRRRPGRLGAHPQRLHRHRRAQADLGPGALHRRVPHRADDRPRRPDHPHRGRRRAGARRHRRAGRARPAPAPRPRRRRPRRRARPRHRGDADRRRHRGVRAAQLRAGRVRRGARRGRRAARRRAPRRGRVDPVAPARREGLGRHRHRGRGRADGGGQRLRHELEGPLRPRGDRALRPGVARGRQPVLRDRQARDAGRAVRHRHLPGHALRDGAEPRPRAARGLRRGALALRRAGHADAAGAGHRPPAARRTARGGHRPRPGDDHEHLRHRRHRPPRLLRARGPGRRAAHRDDDHREAVGRQHGAARRTHLRAGRRGLPGPRDRGRGAPPV
ncbi:MAG: Amidase clustered with urea ABC transporter and nitrile hydratase functions, partial [uncultured Pseudonocardia sp.]